MSASVSADTGQKASGGGSWSPNHLFLKAADCDLLIIRKRPPSTVLDLIAP